MVEKFYVNNQTLQKFVFELFRQLRVSALNFTKVIGIERGGIPLATTLSKFLEIPLIKVCISYYDGQQRRESPIIKMKGIVLSSEDVVLIVDDLVDTGSTIETLTRTLEELGIPYKTAVFYRKPHSIIRPDFFVETTDKWVVFPWELKEEH